MCVGLSAHGALLGGRLELATLPPATPVLLLPKTGLTASTAAGLMCKARTALFHMFLFLARLSIVCSMGWHLFL